MVLDSAELVPNSSMTEASAEPIWSQRRKWMPMKSSYFLESKAQKFYNKPDQTDGLWAAN